MADSFMDRISHAWNAFKDPVASDPYSTSYGSSAGYGYRQDRIRVSLATDRSIVNTVYTQIGVDVATVDIHHVRQDENERYVETLKSGLNDCLSVRANIDQTGREFIRDAAVTMMETGVVALVPIDTTFNPRVTGSYDIQTVRTGEVLEWFPDRVKVRVYDERDGKKKEIIVQKRNCAIVENPFYNIMNEPNSTLKRLVHKLNLLDSVDEQNSSGKLDLIIQLPYVIKTEARREQAELRRKDIEMQLAGSKYGIAYTDGTERVTQLNRPAENNLLKQVEDLRSQLYQQLGMSEEVFRGTASEAAMLNYYTRTIEPILTALTEAMTSTFLTKTARTQGQAIKYFRDPFKLLPISSIADVADRFTRNEILSSNEVRGIIGFKPVQTPDADALRNKNITPPPGYPAPETETMAEEAPEVMSDEEYSRSTSALDEVDSLLAEMEGKIQ